MRIFLCFIIRKWCALNFSLFSFFSCTDLKAACLHLNWLHLFQSDKIFIYIFFCFVKRKFVTYFAFVCVNLLGKKLLEVLSRRYSKFIHFLLRKGTRVEFFEIFKICHSNPDQTKQKSYLKKSLHKKYCQSWVLAKKNKFACLNFSSSFFYYIYKIIIEDA